MGTFIIVGSGGREQCLVELLLKQAEVYSLGGSPKICQLVPSLNGGAKIDLTKPLSEKMLDKIAEHPTAIVIIGPEQPLSVGWVDQIRQKNIYQKVLGPSTAKAQLETSKWWAKEFLRTYNLPTGKALKITSREEGSSALAQFSPPYVIKADGLAGGKGVALFEQTGPALDFVGQILEEGLFGNQPTCLIEEYLLGEEISLFLLMDGHSAVQIGMACDYKRLKDNDQGPNTGGMGAYSPLENLGEKDQELLYQQILRPLLQGLHKEDLLYKGFLYLGLIRGTEGFSILEFNVRLGDPESQVILPLLGDSLEPLLSLAAEGRLSELSHHRQARPLAPDFWVVPTEGTAVCVVLADPSYPIFPLDEIPLPDLEHHLDQRASEVYIFQGGTKKRGDHWVSSAGRVLNVVALHPTLQGARQICYQVISQMNYPALYCRQDIGKL